MNLVKELEEWDKQIYKEQGFFKKTAFVPECIIDKMNLEIDNIIKYLSTYNIKKDHIFEENRSGKYKQIQYLHNYSKIFEMIMFYFKKIVGDLIHCEDLEVLNMQLFEKHPKISKPTRSHQDNAYFKVDDPDKAITVWISLDDISEENGCMYYAPRTHELPTRKHSRYHNQTTFRMRSGVPGLSLCLHEHPEETDIKLSTQKGDVLFHHPNTIHRAGKNTSNDKRRRAIGIVFISKSCKKDERLMKYFEDNLKHDIELQKYKDPQLYEELIENFKTF